jgi:predicted metal-dependent hydrolase
VPTTTPDDLVIRPRDMSFHCDPAGARWWLGNDPVATAYFNIFSASFPQAERYFIDSVRRYRDSAAPKLKEQIAAFIAQESLHSREHISFNRAAVCGGYDLSRIEQYLRAKLDWARTLSPLTQAASTAALEHFTTILSREAVGNPVHLASAPAEFRRLWNWHCGEEIEHKAVAFDTFMFAAQSKGPVSRWVMRCGIMLCCTWLLFDFLFRGLNDLFRQDGMASFRTWMRFSRFALVTPGALRLVTLPYLSWYIPGFHPWRRDDRRLIAQAERAIAPSPA